MGVFVNYLSNPFAGLRDVITPPQIILAATSNTLIVNSIIVCNRGAQDMRFNLKKIRSQTIVGTPPTIEIFYVNEFEIKAYNTVDVVAELGLQLLLEFSETPPISDSLICFSNGYTQVFDCEVTYTQLNELPMN